MTPSGDGADHGWFTEASLPFASEDVRLSVRVTRSLHESRSAFNHIQVLDTPFFGRVLVLDGIVNIAADTEFIYHEMMVTLPCVRHGAPRSVLIVGGGDGGAAKHALRVATVERIVNVEVDRAVVDACTAHLPEIAGGAFADARVETVIEDGRVFLQRCRETFDVIVLDVTDPVPGGPAEELISLDFLRDVSRRLAEGGVLATHAGCVLLQPEKTKLLCATLAPLFAHVELHMATIPEFELTECAFVVCSSSPEPREEEIRGRFASLVLGEQRYLTADVFFSSKVLPPYTQELIGAIGS
ncbi:MAG: fused MFS/spermidine synthase [Gaiellaceae bacterium]